MFEQHPGEDFAANDETSMVNWQGNATASLVPSPDFGRRIRSQVERGLPTAGMPWNFRAVRRATSTTLPLSHEAIQPSPVRKHRRR